MLFHTGDLKLFSCLLFFVILTFLAPTAVAQSESLGDGIGIAQLRAFANTQPQVEFAHLRDNPTVSGERREVVSFDVDGLHQFALILWPAGEKPEEGWPVLLFNHGYHPNPPDYGRIASGANSRPGDYYRGVAQAFVDAGFVVVTADYRGHNDSEGADYTSRVLADHWYTRDAIATYFGLTSLAGIDRSRVYMLGHSMGGPITQRASLVLGDKIRAASIWSSSSENPLRHLASRELGASVKTDALDIEKPGLDRFMQEMTQIGTELSYDDLTARKFIDELQVPLVIQHSRGDKSTLSQGSLELAGRLYMSNKKYQLFIYDSDAHLFDGDDFQQAVDRNLKWFESHR